MVDFREIEHRVTVRDLLAESGIKPDRNRIACPIHGGKNRSSFAFTDGAFICHSCGAKGGLLDLTEHLYECSRQDALRKLCGLAGIEYIGPGNRESGQPYDRSPVRLRPYDVDYELARERLAWAELRAYGLGVCLKLLRRNMQVGKVPLNEFYAQEQLYLYELEELDPTLIEMNHKLNEIKRRKRNSDYNTSSSN